MFHIFHSWDYCTITLKSKKDCHIFESNQVKVRKCYKCGIKQGYSKDLKKWCDIGYLVGTSHDNSVWIKYPCIETILSKPSFDLYTSCDIHA